MTGEHTRSGILVKTVYTAEDIKDLDYREKLGSPGTFPFTRGRLPERRGGWIQRELSGEGEPSRSNEQLKYLLQKGQTGIDVIGDSPTQACLDADHPLAVHTVGTQGVSLCCWNDYRELFRDIPLGSISISSSVPAPFALAGLYLVAKENGVPPGTLRGSVLQAPFYAEDCGYSLHMPFRLRLRLSSDSIQFCSQEMPKFHSFVEDTYFFSEAGLNVVEEMALGFVEIRHVVRDLLRRGVDIDSFAPRIAILVNCGMDFFEEIAKVRATRRIFAKMMKEEFGAKDPRSWAVVVTCHTSGLSLTAQQPFNNIVRGTIQALALVLAGVDALEISAFDEAYRTPCPESHLVALRTQQVIHLESNISKVVDPLGGSYYVEALTSDVEERIQDMIMEIEAKGDPADLSDAGWFKRFFEERMDRYYRQISSGELPKVGVNVHVIPDHEDTLLRDVAQVKIEPSWGHVEQIKRFKTGRDKRLVEQVLRDVHKKAKTKDENLMYPILTAMESGASMGEIAGVLRMAYGFPYDPHGLIESPI